MIEILMVEDDKDIAMLLEEFLKLYNMNLTTAPTPNVAISYLEINFYELIILDLSLPQMDGLELFKIIKKSNPKTPIIISTARGSVSDKVSGLELGADDYLPKPYDPRELVARINTVLRRVKNMDQSGSDSEFLLDEEKMQIFKEGEELNLTQAEYELLRLFILKKGFVLSRDYIANNVDALKWESSERSIDVIVVRLRQKIGDDARKPKYIKTLRGMGYRFL